MLVFCIGVLYDCKSRTVFLADKPTGTSQSYLSVLSYMFVDTLKHFVHTDSWMQEDKIVTNDSILNISQDDIQTQTCIVNF